MTTSLKEIEACAETHTMYEPIHTSKPSHPLPLGNPNSSPSEVRQTHRCRLYRTVRNVIPGQDLYTEVWDSIEEPEDVADMAAGSELVKSFDGSSTADLRKRVDAYRQEQGFRLRGNWKLRGSI